MDQEIVDDSLGKFPVEPENAFEDFVDGDQQEEHLFEKILEGKKKILFCNLLNFEGYLI